MYRYRIYSVTEGSERKFYGEFRLIMKALEAAWELSRGREPSDAYETPSVYATMLAAGMSAKTPDPAGEEETTPVGTIRNFVVVRTSY